MDARFSNGFHIHGVAILLKHKFAGFASISAVLAVVAVLLPGQASASTGTTDQFITLTNNAAEYHRGQPIDITAVSDSGLDVVVTSQTPVVCSVSDNVVKAIAPGSCSLLGDQAGDDTFATAQTATLNFNIDYLEPLAPTNVGVTPNADSITVAWDAPSDSGNLGIDSYTATTTPGGFSCTTSNLTCEITGLTRGVRYDVNVVATNSVGASPASASSAPALAITMPYLDRRNGCAITPASTVQCFGGWVEAVPADLGTVLSIANNEAHACAVKTSGETVCWGYPDARSQVPQFFPLAKRVITGFEDTCVITTTDALQCFGNRSQGNLSVPSNVTEVKDVYMGQNDWCAVRLNGTVACWGDNGNEISNPSGFSAINNAIQVTVGDGFACALLSSGTVNCWGNNVAYYGLSNVSNLTGIAKIFGGWAALCLVDAEGALKCFGSDPWGRVSGVPASLPPVKSLAMTEYTMCAVLENSLGIRCWGYTGDPNVANFSRTLKSGTAATPAVAPSAPADAVAILGDKSITVHFVPSLSNGGSEIFAYRATEKRSGNSCSVRPDTSPLECTITGLTNGRSYVVEARAVNIVGASSVAKPIQALGVSVSMDGATSCAILADHKLVCWGSNPDDYVLNVPGNLGTVKAVAISGEHRACAVLTNGTVRCWGTPNGWVADREQLSTLSHIKLITAGWYHFCVVSESNVFTCWGYNGEGQLNTPSDFGSIVKVKSTDRASCALNDQGQLACWGSTPTPPSDLAPVTDFGLDPWSGCAVLASGSIQCWGADNAGLITNIPTGHAPYSAIDVARYAACALGQNGEVDCWGSGDWGRSTVPSDLTGATQISLGWDGADCAVRTDALIECWGAGDGRIYPPTTQITSTPGTPPSPVLVGATNTAAGVLVQWTAPASNGYAIDSYSVQVTPNDGSCADVPATNATTYSCTVTGLHVGTRYVFTVTATNGVGTSTPSAPSVPGRGMFFVKNFDENYACAVDSAGSPLCWGDNRNGRTDVPPGLTNVKSISAQSDHACALSVLGSVICWGYNGDGRSRVPSDLPALSSLSGNNAVNCGVATADHTLHCFGTNDATFTIPSDVTSSQSVSVGPNNICNVSLAGAVTCWGYNYEGINNVPVDLPAATAVSVGPYSACAITVATKVVCWGNPGNGELDVPADLTDVVQLESSYWGNCAVTSTGSLVCWGWDGSGRFSQHPLNLAKVQSVSMSFYSTCVEYLANSGMRCWGDTNPLRVPGPSLLYGNTVTYASVPSAPRNSYVESKNHALIVHFGAPASDGSSPILSYMAKINDSYSCVAAADISDPHCTITGLENGRSYPVRTFAVNAVGSSRDGQALVFTKVAGHSNSFCGLKADHKVLCWSVDTSWQNLLKTPSDLGPVADIAFSSNMVACAVLMAGTVRCWGNSIDNSAYRTLTDVETISAGYYVICVLRSTGAVVCFGSDNYGESDVPTDLPQATKVTVGLWGACAILVDHSVRCWGSVPVIDPDLRVLDFAFDGPQACAVLLDRTLTCFGDDWSGLVSQRPTNLVDVQSVYVLNQSACAIDGQSHLYCWGNNNWGRITVPSDLGATTQIAITENEISCVVHGDGSISCLGYTYDGRANYPTSLAGNPGTVPSAPRGVEVNRAPRGVRVTWQAPASDGSHALIGYRATANPGGQYCETTIGVDGNPLSCTITGLTKNISYHIGVQAMNDLGSSRAVTAKTLASEVSVLGEAACAVSLTGAVNCWGNQSDIVSGIPDDLGTAVSVAVSWRSACALINDGTVRCWGNGEYNSIAVPDGLTDVVEIAEGGYHGCALKSDGTVVCWGFNGNDRGNGGQATVPAGLTGVAHIVVGERSTCAVLTSGAVNCWGDSYAPPSDLGPVVSVSPSGWDTCAVLIDNTVRCWGENAWGVDNIPSDLGEVKTVSIEYGTACAVKMDDSVQCWGNNDWGKRDFPVETGSVLQIDTGWYNSCVLKTNNSVLCVGNGNGVTDLPQDFSSTDIEAMFGPSRPEITSIDTSGSEVTVHWLASVDDGGSEILSYTAVLTPGGQSCQVTPNGSPAYECTVEGVDSSYDHTADVYATNAIGDSPVIGFQEQANTQMAYPSRNLSARANDGTLLTFTSSTPSVCEITSTALQGDGSTQATISNVARGNCTITAHMDGALDKTQTYLVAKAHRETGLNMKVMDFSNAVIDWSEVGRTVCFEGKTAAVNLADKAGCPNDNFLVHWSGGITWPGVYDGHTTSTVAFRSFADDGFRLDISGTNVINDPNYHGMAGPTSDGVTFLAGSSQTIDAWMFQGGGGFGAELYWDGGLGGEVNTLVPSSAYVLGGDLPKADQVIEFSHETSNLTSLRVGHEFALSVISDDPTASISFTKISGDCQLTGDGGNVLVMTGVTNPCVISAVGSETALALASEPITMTVTGLEGGSVAITDTDLVGTVPYYVDEVMPDGSYQSGVNDHFVSGVASNLASDDTIDVVCVPQDPQLDPYVLASDVSLNDDSTFSVIINDFGHTYGATTGCKLAATLHGNHAIDTWETLPGFPIRPVSIGTQSDGWGVTNFTVNVWGNAGYSNFSPDYYCPVCTILTANDLGSFAQPDQSNAFAWDYNTSSVWSYAMAHNAVPYVTRFNVPDPADESRNVNYGDLLVDGEHAYTVAMLQDWGYSDNQRMQVSVDVNPRSGRVSVTEESDLYTCSNSGENMDGNCGDIISSNVHLTRVTTIASDGVTYGVSDTYSSLDDSTHVVSTGYEYETTSSSTRVYKIESGVDVLGDYSGLVPGESFVPNSDAFSMSVKYDPESVDGENTIAGFAAMSASPSRIVNSTSTSGDVASGFAAAYLNREVTPDSPLTIQLALTQFFGDSGAVDRKQMVLDFVDGVNFKSQQSLVASVVSDQELATGSTTISADTTSGLAVIFTSTTPEVCSVDNFGQLGTVSTADVTFISAGQCSITESIPGDDDYYAAQDVTVSFAVIVQLVDETAVTISEADLLALPEAQLGASSLVKGAQFTVTYAGFQVDENVQLIIASTPVLLGHAHADAQGAVSVSGRIPTNFAAGEHHLALFAPASGTGFQMPVTIKSSTTPGPTHKPTPSPSTKSEEGSGVDSQSGSGTGSGTTTETAEPTPSASTDTPSPTPSATDTPVAVGGSNSANSFPWQLLVVALLVLVAASVMALRRRA